MKAITYSMMKHINYTSNMAKKDNETFILTGKKLRHELGITTNSPISTNLDVPSYWYPTLLTMIHEMKSVDSAVEFNEIIEQHSRLKVKVSKATQVKFGKLREVVFGFQDIVDGLVQDRIKSFSEKVKTK